MAPLYSFSYEFLVKTALTVIQMTALQTVFHDEISKQKQSDLHRVKEMVYRNMQMKRTGSEPIHPVTFVFPSVRIHFNISWFLLMINIYFC